MITGVVEGTSNKFGKFSVLVDGTWYATKEEWAPTPRPNKGDTITFDNKGAKFLNNCKIVSSNNSVATGSGEAKKAYSRGSFPIDPLDGQRSIIRQNALTNARELFTAFTTYNGETVEELAEGVIRTARVFEAYTAGDIDRQRAKELADKMSAQE